MIVKVNGLFNWDFEYSAFSLEKFAAAFGAGELRALTGWVHDIGKYSDGFQKRLLQNEPRVDHATAGAIGCVKQSQSYAAFCVVGHHTGLPNLGNHDEKSGRTLLGRINNDHPSYAAWKREISLPRAKLPAFADGDPCTEAFQIRVL